MAKTLIRTGSRWKRLLWKLSSPGVLNSESFAPMVVVAWLVFAVFGSLTFGRIPWAWIPFLLTACAATLFNTYVKNSLKRQRDIFFDGFYVSLFAPLVLFSFLTLGLYGLVAAADATAKGLSLIPLGLSLFVLCASRLYVRLDASGLTIRRLLDSVTADYTTIDRMEVLKEHRGTTDSVGHMVDRLYIHLKDGRSLKLSSPDMPIRTCGELMDLIDKRSRTG